jgi:hypothetical protein
MKNNCNGGIESDLGWWDGLAICLVFLIGFILATERSATAVHFTYAKDSDRSDNSGGSPDTGGTGDGGPPTPTLPVIAAEK